VVKLFIQSTVTSSNESVAVNIFNFLYKLTATSPQFLNFQTTYLAQSSSYKTFFLFNSVLERSFASILFTSIQSESHVNVWWEIQHITAVDFLHLVKSDFVMFSSKEILLSFYLSGMVTY